MQSTPPLDADASTYDVLAIYGALMQQVQTFEVLLATLALLVESDPKQASNAGLERQLKKAIVKGVHAFQNGSPAASRDRLQGKIPEDLFGELADLVPPRNRLAHSFLVQQTVDGGDGPRFRVGTALQIVEYAQRFEVLNRRLQDEIASQAATFPQAPEPLRNLIDGLAQAVVLDRPLAGSE
jgi:hypothetical protein